MIESASLPAEVRRGVTVGLFVGILLSTAGILWVLSVTGGILTGESVALAMTVALLLGFPTSALAHLFVLLLVSEPALRGAYPLVYVLLLGGILLNWMLFGFIGGMAAAFVRRIRTHRSRNSARMTL